jgi:flagellar motor component MotA
MKKNYNTTEMGDTLTAIGIIAGFFGLISILAYFAGVLN